MVHRGVCPDLTCQLLRKEQYKELVQVDLYKAIGKELGLPWRTVQTIIRRHGFQDSNESIPKVKPKGPFETCAISDLQRLIDTGKKFGTIYADPPWKYSNQATRASTDKHYETMTPEEIAELPIKSLAAEKAHLHLWTTNAFLFECPKIFDAWGFEYKGIFVWTKKQMGIGNYWRVSHEFLVLGVRETLRFYDNSQMSWIATDRTKHSVKPERVAEIIEKVSPGPYLELFGRRTRDHWTVWGDEIERTLFNEAAFKN